MDNTKDKIDSIYFMLSGIFAIFLYILLILLMTFIFRASSNYINIAISTPSAISSINVNIIDESPQPKKQSTSQSQTQNNTDKNNDTKQKDIGSSKPVSGFGMGDLFDKIDIKKPNSKNEILADNRDKVALNKLGSLNSNDKLDKIIEKTDNIMQTLSNLNQNITISDEASSAFCIKYSDYCKEVRDMLYKNWNTKSWFDNELSSNVAIKISKQGNFSYTIKKKSGNAMFDNELEYSLESLKNIKFPTIENIDIDNLIVTFRNSKEG